MNAQQGSSSAGLQGNIAEKLQDYLNNFKDESITTLFDNVKDYVRANPYQCALIGFMIGTELGQVQGPQLKNIARSLSTAGLGALKGNIFSELLAPKQGSQQQGSSASSQTTSRPQGQGGQTQARNEESEGVRSAILSAEPAQG
jgi:hypothetical protein